MAEQIYPLTFEGRELNPRMLGGLGELNTPLCSTHTQGFYERHICFLIQTLITATSRAALEEKNQSGFNEKLRPYIMTAYLLNH